MTKEEALARRLCEAAGDDPYAQVLIVKELPRTRLGFLVLPKDLHMNAFDGWQFYRNQARAALVFLGHSPEALETKVYSTETGRHDPFPVVNQPIDIIPTGR